MGEFYFSKWTESYENQWTTLQYCKFTYASSKIQMNVELANWEYLKLRAKQRQPDFLTWHICFKTSAKTESKENIKEPAWPCSQSMEIYARIGRRVNFPEDPEKQGRNAMQSKRGNGLCLLSLSTFSHCYSLCAFIVGKSPAYNLR